MTEVAPRTDLITPGSRVAHYAERSLAENTRRAYRADIAHFDAWCRERGVNPLPVSPETVAEYLAAYARAYNTTTLEHRLHAIGQMHQIAGIDFNTKAAVLRHTMRGIKREHGTPPRRAAALGTREVLAMVAACPKSLAGIRDKALILFGFSGALRRSEIIAVDVEHLVFAPDALRVMLPRSKGDAAGQGTEVVIPRGRKRETCPVVALQRWIEVSATEFGPVFRAVGRFGRIGEQRLSGETIRQIVIRAASRAGIAVAAHEALSPHGLRAGFITEAYRRGALPEEIMHHARHKDWSSTRRYIRRSGKLADNPARLLGL